MAKTAMAAPAMIPTPATHEAQARSYRAASLEERTAVLETRWEETVPTLATSRDISDLRGEMSEIRGEMRNLENRLIKWGVGAVIALAAVFSAMLAANTARIDQLAARQDARMDALDAKIDARFDALMAQLRERN